jgi:hypothetical protein
MVEMSGCQASQPECAKFSRTNNIWSMPRTGVGTREWQVRRFNRNTRCLRHRLFKRLVQGNSLNPLPQNGSNRRTGRLQEKIIDPIIRMRVSLRVPKSTPSGHFVTAELLVEEASRRASSVSIMCRGRARCRVAGSERVHIRRSDAD